MVVGGGVAWRNWQCFDSKNEPVPLIFKDDGKNATGRCPGRRLGDDVMEYDNLKVYADTQIWMMINGNGELDVRCPEKAIPFVKERMQEISELYHRMLQRDELVEIPNYLKKLMAQVRSPAWHLNSKGDTVWAPLPELAHAPTDEQKAALNAKYGKLETPTVEDMHKTISAASDCRLS